MAAPSRTPLSDLPKGHRFSPTTLQLTAEDVARYLSAVGDDSAIYLERGVTPPLAVAALALGALLETIELPDGTLHSGQELEVRGGVPLGAELTLTGSIAQRSERAGLIISVIEFEVTAAGEAGGAIGGRTTVVAPTNAAEAGQ